MPAYSAEQDFRHDGPERSGVLVVNLGTPDSPTRGALYRFLREFLSDPRVVELPRWIWLPILYGIILNIRPGRSAEAYRGVWTPDGSPLMAISKRQYNALASTLERSHPDRVVVALGMRYGRPSIAAALRELRDKQVRRILVLPLYPQYSASTSGSVFDAVADELRTWRWVPELRFIDNYHDHPLYIAALAEQLREHWDRHQAGERLLVSFHGIPRRYFLAGDPYHCHCHKTTRLLAETLQLDPARWQLVFQSRFGREEWLQPYCDATLKQLAADGIRSVDVITPGFAADCLETLEEINERYRDLFLSKGGERFEFIHCLNDRPAHIHLLSELVVSTMRDWLAAPVKSQAERDKTLHRARAMGASQ